MKDATCLCQMVGVHVFCVAVGSSGVNARDKRLKYVPEIYQGLHCMRKETQ